MKANEWHPTAYIEFRNGVLSQKWARECTEWVDAGLRGYNRKWVEHEWREVKSVTVPRIADDSGESNG